ncbi:Orf y [Tanacetum coccineum]
MVQIPSLLSHDQPSSSRLNEPDEEPLTSTFVEDETAGGSFHESPPRSHEATPFAGQPFRVAEDPLTLTALSSLVSMFMPKTTSLECELKDTKKILGTAIITLVGRVKKLEGALKKRKRKPIISDSDDDAKRVEKEIDMDSLLALANASLAAQQSSFVTPSKDNDSGEVAKSPAHVSSRSVKTYTRASKGSASEDTSSRIDFHQMQLLLWYLPAGVCLVPTSVSSLYYASSEQIPPVSTSVDKGKAQLVDEPTPTQERTFKQLEDERLGWEAAERLHAQEQAELERQQEELLRQDELLACQLDQDFDIPAQQKKRQQEVQAAAMHYTDDDWITIMAKIQANEELSRTLIGSNLPEGDFASAMVEMVDRKRRQIAEQKAKARRDMSQAEQRDFMRTFSHLSTLTQQDFTRASKRLGDELEQPSSKRPKHAEVEATSAAMEDTGAQLPIQCEDVRTSKESEVMEEKVESSKRTPRKRKSVARKGLHISKSTIPIETGDPDVQHKMCLKYAFDEEDDSDCDTLVPFYAIVDWELLPTGLGTINVIYRKDNSLNVITDQDKEDDGVGLILWGDLRVLIDSPEEDDGSEFWKSQHKWRIQRWKLYSFSGIHVLLGVLISGLVIYMFVDKKYPLTVKLMERMMDYQLEIGHGAVDNKLTTAVQLVKFLKKQIADSKHAGVHDCTGSTIWLLMVLVIVVSENPIINLLMDTTTDMDGIRSNACLTSRSRLMNLLRESEKLMRQQWRTAYPGEYSAHETIADDPKNITSQLAVKLGKLYFPSTTENLFAKLPPSLSKKIEESFKAKHPGLSAGVLPAIKFTHTFVSEMCKDTALAKELRDLSLCSAIPIPGYYKNNRKKNRIRKSRTYKGNPHNSHVKPFKRKYKDDRGRVKKCKCFICGKERHFAKDCIYFDDSNVYNISEGEGDVHQNISIMVQDTPFEEAAFMEIKGINESDDEKSIKEDYYSHHAFMFHPGPPIKIADMVQSAGSWKPDKELPTQRKSCEHDWKENTVTNYIICYYCGILTTCMSRLNCPKCQLTTCALCARNYLGKTVNVKGKQPHKPKEEKDFNSFEVRFLKELLKENTEQVQQMIKDQAKEYYENRAIIQRKEELFEEQKDEEIRKLKTQLQKEKEKETEARYSSEEFPPLGNS